MAKTSNVIEFLVKGGKAAVRQFKMQTEAMKGYVKNLKILDKTGIEAFRNNRNLTGSFSVLRSKLLLASFAFGMVAKTVGKYIKVAADAQEITNKFNVVFGKASDSADQFATVLGQATGRSSTKLKEMLSSLQDTFVPLGFARDSSAKLSKALSQLSLDVASFNNRVDTEVMKAFQSAIVGNHEAVRSFGIVLTETSVKQEALKMGLIKTNRELSSQEKVLARVSLIYNSTKDAQGDLIKTQGSYTNQLKAFNDQIFELQKSIGQGLMPIASVLLNLASRFADTTFLQVFATTLGTIAFGYGLIHRKALMATKSVTLFGKAIKRTAALFVIFTAIELVAKFIDSRKAADDLSESVDDLSDSFKNLADLTKNSILQTTYNEETLDSANSMYAYATEQIDFYNAKIAEEEKALKKLKEQATVTAEELFKIADMEKNVDALKASRDGYEQTRTEAQKLAETIAAAHQPTKDFKKFTEANTKAHKEFIESLAGGLNIWQQTISEDAFMARLDFSEKLKTLQTTEQERQKNFLTAELEEFKELGIGKIELAEYEKLRLAEINQEAHDEEIEKLEEKKQIYSEFFNEVASQYGGLANATKKQADATLKNDINALKQTQNWRVATAEQREVLEEDIRAKHAKKQQRAFNYEKNASMLSATVNAYEAVTKTYAKVPPPFNVPAAAAVAALAFAQVSAISGTPAPSYAMGGLIEGSSHSAGGVMINAEGGEFVMNKGAVDSIGTDALESMNQGGAGVIVNITGNVMTDDFTRDKIIPEIQQAIRLNLA